MLVNDSFIRNGYTAFNLLVHLSDEGVVGHGYTLPVVIQGILTPSTLLLPLQLFSQGKVIDIQHSNEIYKEDSG